MARHRYYDDDAFDENGLLKDGRSVRVPLMMRDGMSPLQRSVAEDAVARRVGFDDSAARYQQGPIIADRTAAREAYRQMCEDMESAWRNRTSAPAATAPQSPVEVKDARPAIPVTDADFARLRQIRQAAYEDAKAELSEAWRTPSAPAATAPPCRDAAPPPRAMDAVTARRIKQEAYDAMCAEMRSAWKNAVP